MQSNECEWSQKCEAATEERARREELAAQLLATQQDRYRILSERDALRAEVERLRAVVEAARVLLGTLNVDESGLYKVVDVADEVGCSNLGGTSFEEHPDVDGAMEQMAAALAALDAAKEAK